MGTIGFVQGGRLDEGFDQNRMPGAICGRSARKYGNSSFR
jgi:hypothetical protein